MNISKQIKDILLEEYRSGMTQEQIAAKHHVKHPQISRILSGQRDPGGLSTATIEKMFPRATINLYGEPAAPALPNDPFLRIVIENWSNLTPEERGRVAGLVSGLVEGKNHAASRADSKKRIG